MKSGTLKKVITGLLAGAMVLSVSGCNSKSTYYDNESDPLVFSTLECDKVFNPFFYTSGTDGNVVGLTQISMLSNDSAGQVTYGDDEAVVTKDLQTVTQGTPNVDQTTTYYFVLKNNVQFSNGSYLSIKDVLFNLYVYLDPVYTGSSTIYSTDIVGLAEYRTQASTEKEQESFMTRFETKAKDRIDALVAAAEEIFEDTSTVFTKDTFRTRLEEFKTENNNTYYTNIVEDFDKAAELFMEELETDYTNSMDAYDTTVFSDENKNLYYPFTTDVEVFLYNEGFIDWDKEEAKVTSSLTNNPEELKNWTKQQAINIVYDTNIPDKIDEVVQYWNTSVTLSEFITYAELEEYSKTATRTYKNISGIQFANRTSPVTVNGITYEVPQYNDAERTSVMDGYNEVLSITIHDVDPKAIWNFALPIAPMYYYSDAAHIAAFDYEENFGVEYMSQTFMNNVVKNPDKVGVPVGAGPYAASRSSGGITGVTSGEFYDRGVIYYERNPYYVMGPAKIKKVRYQVVSSTQMLNTLYNGEIDYSEPNAKPETISELNKKKSDGIGYKSVETAGYGYIGINAGKVPDIKVRQAIMHAINTQLCVSYYGTEAKALYRSMSSVSWAYPEDATPYYPYIGGPVPSDLTVVNPDYAAFVLEKGKSAGQTFTEAEQIEFLTGLVEEAGYTLGSDGVYVKGSNTLKYTFTIAGEETDHPAWNAMVLAGEILNKAGFSITVTTDANALKKLASGALTVWAAAWSSTIDPDMYQVYHKDSTASSVLNWGYKQIKMNTGGKYDVEVGLLDELSDWIDLARTTDDQDTRATYYSYALDLVMQLAIELPTYQRKDLYAYNTKKIDTNTLNTTDLSPYKGLTADLHLISLNVAK